MKSFKHHFWIESEDIVFNRIMERMRLRHYNRLVEFFSIMLPMQIGVVEVTIERRMYDT